MIELLLQAERALTVGLVDQAERMYAQAHAADPRNSIAVVGLARVALERGDDVLAWSRAREALAIDPENIAAQRLVQRLEEVHRYRGESLPDMAAARGLGLESVAEPEAEVEPEPELDAEVEPEPELDAEPELGVAAVAEPEPAAEPAAELEARSEAESEAEPVPEPDAESGSVTHDAPGSAASSATTTDRDWQSRSDARATPAGALADEEAARRTDSTAVVGLGDRPGGENRDWQSWSAHSPDQEASDTVGEAEERDWQSGGASAEPPPEAAPEPEPEVEPEAEPEAEPEPQPETQRPQLKPRRGILGWLLNFNRPWRRP